MRCCSRSSQKPPRLSLSWQFGLSLLIWTLFFQVQERLRGPIVGCSTVMKRGISGPCGCLTKNENFFSFLFFWNVFNGSLFFYLSWFSSNLNSLNFTHPIQIHLPNSGPNRSPETYQRISSVHDYQTIWLAMQRTYPHLTCDITRAVSPTSIWTRILVHAHCGTVWYGLV